MSEKVCYICGKTMHRGTTIVDYEYRGKLRKTHARCKQKEEKRVKEGSQW